MKKILTLLVLAASYGGVSAQNKLESTGNIGIGTLNPSAKLSFNDVDDGSNGADGITWYNTAPLIYGIYRTPGAWVAPGYQQLKMSWDTGLILDPGSLYQKSYVDIQGNGLRVTSGNVGIGTTTPLNQLHVNGVMRWGGTSSYIYSGHDGLGGWIEQKSEVGPENKMRIQTSKNGDNINYAQFYVDAQNGFSFQTIGGANGNVGIGIATPQEKLSVNGNIRAREVKVEATNWPDYVFEKDYQITALAELEQYIKTHKHLPNMPSAQQINVNGLALGEMVKLQQQKIEELTLHLIEKDKSINKQQALIATQQKQLERIENTLKLLQKQK